MAVVVLYSHGHEQRHGSRIKQTGDDAHLHRPCECCEHREATMTKLCITVVPQHKLWRSGLVGSTRREQVELGKPQRVEAIVSCQGWDGRQCEGEDPGLGGTALVVKGRTARREVHVGEPASGSTSSTITESESFVSSARTLAWAEMVGEDSGQE